MPLTLLQGLSQLQACSPRGCKDSAHATWLTKLIHRRLLWNLCPFLERTQFLRFSSFQYDAQSAVESEDGRECRSTHNARLAHTGVLAGPHEASEERTSPTAMPGRPAHPSKPPRDQASPPPKNETSGMQNIRECHEPGQRRAHSHFAFTFHATTTSDSIRKSYKIDIKKNGCHSPPLEHNPVYVL